jgi:signal transduction histidine kinase
MAIAPRSTASRAPSSSTGATRLVFVGAGLLAAVALLQVLAQVAIADRNIVPSLILWGIQMPVTVAAVAALHRKLEGRRTSPLVRLVLCIALAGAIGITFNVGVAAFAVHHPMFRPRVDRMPNLWRSGVFGFVFGQLHCGLWALAFVFPSAVHESDRLRAEAEIAQLRAHLEPHFLLNALNAVSGLVTEDPKEARRLVGALGDLLRDAVNAREEQRPLREEIAWLERYARVLSARYPDTLTFEWDVQKEAEPALVPRLLLQPLVENAVRHGALKREHGGKVVVRVRAVGEGAQKRLECEVADDGPGMRDDSQEGFGLRSVRRRLELKHPGASLRVDSSSAGARCIAILPWSVA